MRFMTAVGTAALALSLGVNAPALAQASVSNAGPAVMVDHSMMRSSKIIGGPVYNAKGEEIGTIEDVLVDPNGGPPEAILSVGKYLGAGDKSVAVPLSTVEFGSGKMMIPEASKLTLEKMQAFVWRNFTGPVRADFETPD